MGEAKRVLEQAIEHWNAGDREAWARLYADDVVYEAEASGSEARRGREPGKTGERLLSRLEPNDEP
jgi:hypothetical protein